MQNWDRPLDKGPLGEESNPHRKKAKHGPKRFVIERRYVGPKANLVFRFLNNREWKVDRKYDTFQKRDSALALLLHRSKNSYKIDSYWEYRPRNLGPAK